MTHDTEALRGLTGWLAIETAPTTPDCYHDLPGDAREGLGFAISSETDQIEYLVWWKYVGNGCSETTHWMRKPDGPPAGRQALADREGGTC
jgi:hypothetical protein